MKERKERGVLTSGERRLSFLTVGVGGIALSNPDEIVRIIGVGLIAGAFISLLVNYVRFGPGSRKRDVIEKVKQFGE